MDMHTAAALDFELDDVKIAAPAGLITPVIAIALSTGTYEAEEARIVKRALKPGDRVLEIGAGLGFISTLIARDTRCAELTAVEADPRVAGAALDTLRRNGCDDAVVICGLFGNPEEASEAVFHQRQDFWMSSMVETDIPSANDVHTPVHALADVLSARRISLLVCDIEGAEVDLLTSTDLKGVERIVVELHDHVTGLSGVGRLFAGLAAQGFLFDPRATEGSVVLFRRIGDCPDKRPYDS